MKFKDVSLGSIIRIGTNHAVTVNGSPKPFQWLKVSESGLMIASDSIPSVYQVDRARPLSGETARERTHGRAFFPDTCLFQFLNSGDGVYRNGKGWYVPTDTSEQGPSYRNQSGFLSWFDPDELKCLIPWQMKIKMPNRLVRRYGEVFTKEVLVGLPSISELRVESDRDGFEDRRQFECVTEKRVLPLWHSGIATRSIIGESIWAVAANGNTAPKAPNDRLNIYPMICLNPDTDLELTDTYPVNKYTVQAYSQTHEQFMLALEAMLDL